MINQILAGFLAVGTQIGNPSINESQCGSASWYALDSVTASGERMNPDELTAAHPTLKMGARVRVTNQSNGQFVIVRINDRGPFAKKRIIDLSRAAASRLDFLDAGHTRVCIDPVG